MRAVKRPAVNVTLATVLVLTTLTFGAGFASKIHCAGGDWADGRQYKDLCYTDIIPLFGTEQLTSGRLPFLDTCAPVTNGSNCDEYPVLTMYFMRTAAIFSNGSVSTYFVVTSVMLLLCALITAACLYFMVGSRALYFAVAPTLAILGVINWDMFAVALATGGLLAYFLKRNAGAGALLGLGAATKLFPGFQVIPLIADRLRRRDPDGAITIGWTSVATFAVVNAPFAIVATAGWWEFFRFNAERCADFDSLWAIGWRYAAGPNAACSHTTIINELSPVLFVASFAAVWVWKARRTPDFARWTLGFPLLVLFLLTSKVYSPQYGLWLLPWFALALPGVWRFAAFELADLFVFVTRFEWFGRYSGFGGPPQWLFETAVIIRAVVLLWCVLAWVRRPNEPLLIELASAASSPGAANAPEPAPEPA